MFTKEEIEELLANENVTKCSEKAITYNKKFKLEAVKQYEEGLTPQEIFRNAKFNLAVIGRRKPKNCLLDWNRIYRVNGKEGLSKENRGKTKSKGRPKKIKDLTDADKIKRLEIENAYLKAENDFLAKLRAKRRE
jgi:transposase